MTDQVAIALIGAVGTFLMGCVTAGFGYANNRLAKRNEILSKRNGQGIEETRSSIVTLKEQTNSIKDELVRSTDKEAFARGRKVESDENAAAQPPPVGPQGEPGPTGPQGEAGPKGETGKAGKLFG